MKITIEIPNFEIWGNNDETPTDFITEIKKQIIDNISDQVRSRLFKKDKEITTELEASIARMEKESMDKISQMEKHHKEYIDKLINSIREKAPN